MSDIKIRRTEMIDGRVIYSAWQRIDGPTETTAGTITAIDGEWYARIGTDPDRKIYEHLPIGSDARRTALEKAYHLEYRRAYVEISLEYPHTVAATRRDGEIILSV